MPIIKVEMFSGRTRDKKRALAKALTEAFVESCGGTAQSVQIIINDVEKENWGTAGVLAVDRYAEDSTASQAKRS